MSDMNHEVHSAVSENDAQSKKMNKQGKKSLFRSAVTLYVALAIAALVGTLGWFTINTLVFVENETAGNIQISVSSGDLWIAQSLDEFDSLGYNERAQLIEINRQEASTYIDVSGDGETLYYPKSLEINSQNEDVANLSSANNFTDVSGNDAFYVELRVYFRTTSALSVYLSKDSKIEGLQKSLTNVDNVDAFSRTSLFGNFNCDGIVGASRVAFLESDMDAENETLTLKNVWIPNDDIRLTYNDPGTLISANLETNVAKSLRESRTVGYKYLVQNGNVMEERLYTAADYANGVATVTSTTDTASVLADPNTGMINQATPLLDFTDPGSVQTKLLVIRIWFEGTDREADKALNGGMATYNLSFYGSSKADSEYPLATQNAIDNQAVSANTVGVYYNTLRNDFCYYEQSNFNTWSSEKVDNTNYLLYSLDGLDWRTFTNTTCPEVLNPMRGTDSFTVYIRTAETRIDKPGNVVAIRIPPQTGES